MIKNHKTIGTLFFQIALGILFIVSGIWTLQGGSGDEIAVAVKSVFSSDVSKIVYIVFGVIEIIAGIFLLIRLFIPLNTNLDSVLMIIIMICWIIAIIMIDFMGNNSIFNNLNSGFLSFMNKFAYHLLVLGSLIKITSV